MDNDSLMNTLFIENSDCIKQDNEEDDDKITCTLILFRKHD
jgi:hypothetical protein